MNTVYILDDDKGSKIEDQKGLVKKGKNDRTGKHVLSVNGRDYYYSGEVGKAALIQDFNQLIEVGFIEEV